MNLSRIIAVLKQPVDNFIRLIGWAAIAVVAYMSFQITATALEANRYPPVVSLEIEAVACDGGDAVFYGGVVKGRYPDVGLDQVHKLLHFEIAIDGWPSVNWIDESRGSRDIVSRADGYSKLGTRERPIRLIGACGHAFTLRTRHLTLDRDGIIYSEFGPFGGAVEMPSQSLVY